MKLSPNDDCWCGSGKKYKRCHQAKDLLSKLRNEVVKPLAKPAANAVKPGVVGPRREMPGHIVGPDYAQTGKPKGGRGLSLMNTPDRLERMRAACRAARAVLDQCKQAVAPGVTTDAIDAICHRVSIEQGGYPSPLNYHGFPKSMCTSVNEIICHGIPDSRALQNGDIINLDVTLYRDGMHGDLSETVFVGEVDPEAKKLVEVTRECLYRGIRAVRPGGRIRDIGRAIQDHAEAHGYGVVRAFVGHGIGELFHMDPQVPHYYDSSATTEMVPGMVFTIEPMINVGDWRHMQWDDGWTAATIDGKRSAQFEHTVLVTETGVDVLTLADGEII
jgi:methionyl aminopeptidase